mmetsp:Transcript_21151/g.60677  ORF Transcript_21151/g.60677 Transcript_21151/m.60677 type:complete len:208 (-) Transcript_21151:4279-4902(-)
MFPQALHFEVEAVELVLHPDDVDTRLNRSDGILGILSHVVDVDMNAILDGRVPVGINCAFTFCLPLLELLLFLPRGVNKDIVMLVEISLHADDGPNFVVDVLLTDVVRVEKLHCWVNIDGLASPTDGVIKRQNGNVKWHIEHTLALVFEAFSRLLKVQLARYTNTKSVPFVEESHSIAVLVLVLLLLFLFLMLLGVANLHQTLLFAR